MNVTTELNFHGMHSSETIKEEVHRRVERLGQFEQKITKCRVVIDAPHRSARKGRSYRVHLDIHVPGKILAVHRGEEDVPGHESVEQALSDAFDAGERLLRDRHERKSDPRDPID